GRLDLGSVTFGADSASLLSPCDERSLVGRQAPTHLEANLLLRFFARGLDLDFDIALRLEHQLVTYVLQLKRTLAQTINERLEVHRCLLALHLVLELDSSVFLVVT